MNELEKMSRVANNKVTDLDDYHQHSLAKWWADVARTVCDCVKNPFILESNEVTIVSAFGQRRFDIAVAEREVS